jgi:hypothetical protein
LATIQLLVRQIALNFKAYLFLHLLLTAEMQGSLSKQNLDKWTGNSQSSIGSSYYYPGWKGLQCLNCPGRL